MATITLARNAYQGTSNIVGFTRHWVTVDNDTDDPRVVLKDIDIPGHVILGATHPFGGSLFAMDATIADQDEDIPKRFLMEVLYAPPSDTVAGGLDVVRAPGFSAHWAVRWSSANLPLHRLRETEIIPTPDNPNPPKPLSLGAPEYKLTGEEGENLSFPFFIKIGTKTLEVEPTGFTDVVGYDSAIPSSNVTATRTFSRRAGTRNFFLVQGFQWKTNSRPMLHHPPGHVQFVNYSVEQIPDLPGTSAVENSWRVSLTFLVSSERLDQTKYASSVTDEGGNKAAVQFGDASGGTLATVVRRVEDQVDLLVLPGLFF